MRDIPGSPTSMLARKMKQTKDARRERWLRQMEVAPQLNLAHSDGSATASSAQPQGTVIEEGGGDSLMPSMVSLARGDADQSLMPSIVSLARGDAGQQPVVTNKEHSLASDADGAHADRSAFSILGEQNGAVILRMCVVRAEWSLCGVCRLLHS